jgi:uncharacterized protein (TIGR03437 family)
MRLLLFVALALFAAAPAAADVRVVNSASLEDGPVPRGAYVTIFTDAPVSDQTATPPFPWPDTAAGVTVETDGCAPGVPTRRLPILFVGPSGTGSQINLYYPNDYDPDREPFGTCVQFRAPSETLTITPKPGFGGPIRTTISTVPARPALWQNGVAPDGYHVDADTGAQTALADCNATPARCPVATAGRPNRLVVLTSGAEIFSCPVATLACNGDPRASFRLTPPGGLPVEQPLDFLGFGGIFGKEQANLALRADTVPGEYRLSVRISTAGSPAYSQELLVRLGAAGDAVPGPPPAPLPPTQPGPAGRPFLPIVANSFRTRGALTRFLRLSVSNLPPGSRVELACRGRGCPLKRRRFVPRGGRVALLKALKGRRLRAGTRLEVRVVGPRRELKVVRFTLRRGKPPRKVVRCAPAGSRRLVRC